MKLIKRYVHDVTRRLPDKQRDDVAQELTTEIESMVEDRAGGKKPTERQLKAVLMELGSPSLLADQYRDKPRFLIGPDYYEPYVSLLKTLYLVILPLLAFVVWTTEAMTANHTLLSMAIKVAGTLFEVSLHIFFWTTLSFLFVQKMADGQRHDHNWKPDDLPDLPPEQEITRRESYFAIAWSVFAVLATLYQIPAVYQAISPHDVPQFFSAAMWPGWTLGLLAISLIGLATEIVKLIVGGWTRLTVGLICIINVVTIGFFVSLVSQVYPIANPDMMRLLAESLHKPDVAQGVEWSIRLFVYIVVAICVWEIIEAVSKYRKGGTK